MGDGEMDEQTMLTPYARALGIQVVEIDDDVPVLSIEFTVDVQGRPGALHGGAISGLLETAGYALLRRELSKKGLNVPMRPINVTVQFLSAGKVQTTYAAARVVKLGRRTANLFIEAWQSDRKRPIASAVMNVIITKKG